MSTTKLRYIGSGPVDVVPLNNRRVEPDEVIEVDDSLIWDEKTGTGYAWPEENWAEVGSGRKRSVPAEKATDDNEEK